MADIRDVARKTFLQINTLRIYLQISSYDPRLRIYLKTDEIFESLESDIVLQLLHLYIVSESNKKLSNSFKDIPNIFICLRNAIAYPLTHIWIRV